MALVDEVYLVLRTHFAEQVRRALCADPHAPEWDVRRITIGLLRNALPVGEWREPRGLPKVFDCPCRGGWCRTSVIPAFGPDGAPRLAPDGVKQVAYAYRFDLLPGD